jgi:hypothetical protein
VNCNTELHNCATLVNSSAAWEPPGPGSNIELHFWAIFYTLVESSAACEPPGLLSVGEFLLVRPGSGNTDYTLVESSAACELLSRIWQH